MKILYALQPSGVSYEATAIYNELLRYAEVDVLVSGPEQTTELPFPVKYRYGGLPIAYGKKKGLNFFKTIQPFRLMSFWANVLQCPVQNYDLVISDFEPVSAWACKVRRVVCIGLGHRFALLHPKAAKGSEMSWFGRQWLRRYAPVKESFGFHFRSFSVNIFTPIIHPDVRAAVPSNNGHYTVYLPSCEDDIILKQLAALNGFNWEVFSPQCTKSYQQDNVTMHPLRNETLVKSMAASAGILCEADFSASAHALFLRKKLMVIPTAGQYEQACNAAMLQSMGVPNVRTLSRKYQDRISLWLMSDKKIEVSYPETTRTAVEAVFQAWKIQSGDASWEASSLAEVGS